MKILDFEFFTMAFRLRIFLENPLPVTFQNVLQ